MCSIRSDYALHNVIYNKMSFENKVVIITGASSGIGAATAKLFAKEKAKVAIIARNSEKLNNVAKEIKEISEVKPLVIIGDVSKDEDCKAVIEKTVKLYGKIDILVNNAGVATYKSILDEDYVKEYHRIMATNLHGTVVLTHAALPYLLETKGNIVNVSSVCSYLAYPNLSGYGASKAGMDLFTKTIAIEMAPKGVRVNSVNPGPVRTDINLTLGVKKEDLDQLYTEAAKDTPLQIVSDSEEVADLIAFLASDKARSITGSLYTIDCGVSLIRSPSKKTENK